MVYNNDHSLISGLVGQVQLSLLQTEWHPRTLRHHLKTCSLAKEAFVDWCKFPSQKHKQRVTNTDKICLSTWSHLAIDALVGLNTDHQLVPHTLTLSQDACHNDINTNNNTTAFFGLKVPTLKMSPGTSLYWILTSAFLSFNALPHFKMNGTPSHLNSRKGWSKLFHLDWLKDYIWWT